MKLGLLRLGASSEPLQQGWPFHYGSQALWGQTLMGGAASSRGSCLGPAWAGAPRCPAAVSLAMGPAKPPPLVGWCPGLACPHPQGNAPHPGLGLSPVAPCHLPWPRYSALHYIRVKLKRFVGSALINGMNTYFCAVSKATVSCCESPFGLSIMTTSLMKFFIHDALSKRY